MAWARNALSGYVRPEQRWVLLAWLNDQFSYEKNRDLLAGLKETDIPTPGPIRLLKWLCWETRF